jgi:hypothetical protein
MDGLLGTVIEYDSTDELQFPSISICPFEFKWIINKYEETKCSNIMMIYMYTPFI